MQQQTDADMVSANMAAQNTTDQQDPGEGYVSRSLS